LGLIFAKINKLAGAVLDIFYPRVCSGCGGGIEKESGMVCWQCRSMLEFVERPYCEKCGDPVEGKVMHQYECSFCCDNPPAFFMARSVFKYRGIARNLVHAFKYSNATYLASDLADYLAALWDTNCRNFCPDAVIGVPLYPRKERGRGYNQSFLLGKQLASRLGIEFDGTRLKRIVDTKTQTDLKASERRANVKGAFVVRDDGWTSGRFFILVDDVMTTGSTVRECASVLMKAGASGVVVLTVARG